VTTPTTRAAQTAHPIPRRIYVTDCEGPLTRNDNAQELAAELIPQGADLFARLSRYDDFLADVIHKPGYNAGDTLRLLPPFLVAFGATDKLVVEYSARSVLVVPGAPELLAELQELLPCFIVSTSYTPYVQALCEVVRFPFANTRCTTLSLDAWKLPAAEAARLKDSVARIVQRPVIEIPDGAASLDDLSGQDRETVLELDRLFWGEMAGETHTGGARSAAQRGHPLPVAGELLNAVRPVGGGMKLAALEEIVAEQGVGADQIMYVGDSITDAPPLAAVRAWGGVSVSFNGNGYALAAAEIAAAGDSVAPVLELARAFAAGGPAAARETARDWPAAAADERGGPTDGPAHRRDAPAAGVTTGVVGGIAGLLEKDREALTKASLAARKSVRGEHIARLG
jgi:predicted HAD superfamily phosphohydrolase